MSFVQMSIRTKLIIIFVLIKVFPLVLLSWFSWGVITQMAHDMEMQSKNMAQESNSLVGEVAEMATTQSIDALNNLSRDAIERLTTDLARQVALFLYDRDADIRQATRIEPRREAYIDFLSGRNRTVILDDGNWEMNAEKTAWVQEGNQSETSGEVVARNSENAKNFHYRPSERTPRSEKRPLYLEMTFVGLDGMEQVKVTTSDVLPKRLADVSKRENTFCKAERYFEMLKTLQPGEIYVSEVIGPYVKGFLIGGPYSEVRAEKAGIPFEPKKSAYAGKENPQGIRFRGLIRWATPVVQQGKITGYVTLALDHTHLMEFTDHVVPTNERYTITSNAGTGNYAFMWDYKGRNISHPRDYFIIGYDPQTGQPEAPWLEQSLYPKWLEHNAYMPEFERSVEWFDNQSNTKKPSAELTRQGYVGLDCRFLNFAPQCTGWFTLTEQGGSGSFLIFWSNLWKLTTAAAIPYHTGMYGDSKRGFGFVTIGANVDEFNKPARVTAGMITSERREFEQNLEKSSEENKEHLRTTLNTTFLRVTLYTIGMVIVVIFIALWMAGVLTGKITRITTGIRKFQEGNLNFRLDQTSGDEIGQLNTSFNQMADSIQNYIDEVETARTTTQQSNEMLEQEIAERRAAQDELSRHKDHLEEMVRERTSELEKTIQERERAEKELVQSEKMAALGQLIAGIAHEINTPMGAIKSSGSNIKDALKKVQVDLPDLQEKLERELLSLFYNLLRESQKDPVIRTSREERKLVREISGKLNDAGIENSRQVAFYLVQLNVTEYWDTYLPLLQHEQALYLLETVYGLYAISSNAGNINQAVDRISKIIYALKSFIRQSDTNERIETSVIEGMETVLTIYHNQIKQNTQLVKEYEEIPLIMANPDELNQVWTNLIHNALQAMEYKGVLTVSISCKDDFVVVAVSDTGCGIPEENRERIFEAFFTTKIRGEGSGLGLDIVNKIVQKHGGTVTFESELNKGTTFFVALPINGRVE
ncbi:HAMP domain-containing sensor histidine kinase [Desulfogranum japonicum]|uniref:HAMP domain-containing sensor histidine kinase n=1 Tax=Desulfogranum japonicum TaxID=231447 RepID=UPI0004014D59|nr:ATP-binding protein [Desulfogranum japonicum]